MSLIICKSAADIPPVYDDAAMRVSHWLSAPTVDSDNEVIDGAAFDLSAHRKNPIHLFNHDRRQPPIGIYQDAGGNYTLTVKAFPGGGNGLYGTVHYSRANKQGEVVYGLYREGILKGFSAGFMPGPRVSEKTRGGMAYRYKSALLVEGSSVPIAANADALATVVHKGRFAEVDIPADILRQLALMVKKGRTFSTRLHGVKVFPERPVALPMTGKSAGASMTKEELLAQANGILAKMNEPTAKIEDEFGKLLGVFKEAGLTQPQPSDETLKIVSDMAAAVDKIPTLESALRAATESVTTVRAELDSLKQSIDADTTALSNAIESVGVAAGVIQGA